MVKVYTEETIFMTHDVLLVSVHLKEDKMQKPSTAPPPPISTSSLLNVHCRKWAGMWLAGSPGWSLKTIKQQNN